ncbi:MAG: tyrosine--tRNA ligase [Spirochaetales bacterium]|nr:tyrosine--tRNA ligase [Spirochaetales bacterium]
MSSGLEVLKERGFIKQCTDFDKLDKLMSEKKISFYAGFDPTGKSLHVGHMVPLMAMAHLQKSGHRPISLVGGGTALIGDPSGKTEMRKIQTVEKIQENSESMKKQIEKFIDYSNDKALMLNNYEWLGKLNYIEFLRDIGRHFSVNRMLGFETYKMRLETGLSFIEFNYQLLQSYDFLVLNQQHDCMLQIGGDDQWGNIVAGVDLTRRVESHEVFGLTFPLVTRSDGKKMGKTEKGAVFLDPDLFSPYDYFQYWRNVADADVEKFLLLFTFMSVEDITELGKLEGQDINKAKEILAYEQTKIIHGQSEADKAIEAARAAFTAQGSNSVDKSAIPSITVDRAELESGINVMDLYARTALCSSRGEARRLVTQGGASVNEVKIIDINKNIDVSFVDDGELLLKAGKKRYFRIIVE